MGRTIYSKGLNLHRVSIKKTKVLQSYHQKAIKQLSITRKMGGKTYQIIKNYYFCQMINIPT